LSLAISGNNIFAGTFGGGVFLSGDNGESWTEKNSGLTSTRVYSLATSGINIFTGNYGGGVFLTTDNGELWTQKNSGLKNTYIRSLAISGNNIYAGTIGYGVFRAKISDLITDVETEKKGNQQFQIFPNPTSNTLNIQFENDISQIKIYSGLGNEITLPKPVANGNNIQLDVSSLPQGIYYVCVYSGGKVERSRFVKLIDN